MLTLLLSYSLLGEQETDAIEFFPMVAGSSWAYLDVNDGGRFETTDTVLVEEEVSGTHCTPITTSFGGKEVDRAYYAVKGGEIHIVAFDRRNPLTSSYAVLRSLGGDGKWTHDGETFMHGAPADMSLKGRVSKGKDESFDGQAVETLVVTLEMKVLEKFGTPITSVHTAVYGRGIGLLRSESKVKLKKRTEQSSRRLLAYHRKVSP